MNSNYSHKFELSVKASIEIWRCFSRTDFQHSNLLLLVSFVVVVVVSAVNQSNNICEVKLIYIQRHNWCCFLKSMAWIRRTTALAYYAISMVKHIQNHSFDKFEGELHVCWQTEEKFIAIKKLQSYDSLFDESQYIPVELWRNGYNFLQYYCNALFH